MGGTYLVEGKKKKSDLAVLQVGVDVFDQGVVRVTSWEGQLTQRTATNSTLFRLHPKLQTEEDMCQTTEPQITARAQNLTLVFTKAKVMDVNLLFVDFL